MSVPPPLATPEDATGYGYDLPPDKAVARLAQASARVRRAAGQPITPSIVTVRTVPESWRMQLPAPPVIEVQSVSTVADDGTTAVLTGWWWDGAYLRLPASLKCTEVEVTYRRGWEVVSAGLVELVCSIADRLANTPKGMEIGIRSQQDTIDDYSTSTTFAAEQVQVSGDLLPGELTALRAELGTRTVWVVSTD